MEPKQDQWLIGNTLYSHKRWLKKCTSLCFTLKAKNLWIDANASHVYQQSQLREILSPSISVIFFHVMLCRRFVCTDDSLTSEC